MSDGKLRAVRMPRSAKVLNKFKVQRSQWAKWTDVGRGAFNDLYEMMYSNQSLFLHPKQKPVKDEHWQTTAWNAAWIAADNASGV